MFLLEDGAIFRTYGVTNLLEGDFFSWYASEHQWNDDLALQIRKTFKILSKYADKSVMNVAEKSQDFFKELYIEMIPDAVRRSLGEYYTKKWLAKQVVDEALSLADISNWRGLDPCCGSGTFVTVMIDKVLNEISELKDNEKLAILLKRVKGIDLNPIAVLTARVNYFINISHLLGDNTVLEIPIYLGDASYVPQKVIFDGVRCLQYTISTLLNPIEIIIPLSVVNDSYKFSHIMTKIEFDIKSLNSINVFKSLCELSDPADLTDLVLEKIKNLSDSLIQLEKREWNGIWARIITNFLTTANLGIFDIVVGNPPWVDWKNLPSGYRERIKSLCISRKLFSGDALTGGINLNICALIANVAAQNWLSPNGFLAFLMPEPLAFQPSYEGFRNLYLDNDERLYFQKFTNWTKAGNPFKPVTQKFLTYYISANEVDYREGIDTTFYIVKKGVQSSKIEDLDMDNSFTKKDVLLANCHTGKSSFSYIENKGDLRLFSLISGKSVYKGREGIEFYPQELMLFEKSELPSTQNCIALKNYQNDKSKHKIPSFNVLLETEFLFPMVKSVEIERFHLLENKYIVPFPYDEQNPKIPIELNELSRRAPNLANYYQSYKTIILSQTSYNEKIIGQKAEFYALARVGEYSYAKCLVAFRDNSNWKATVVTEIETEWGGKKRPLFQNHAVTICQDGEGKFIDFDEAHYICGILNAPVTSRYIMSSSDSRSYPIRPRIYIPKYNEQNETHRKISKLSKMAHEHYSDKKFIKEVDKQLDIQYIKLVSEQK